MVVASFSLPTAAAEVALSAGAFDTGHFSPVFEIGVEVRLVGTRLFGGKSWDLIPAFGAMATIDKSVYAYGGFRFNVKVAQRWLVTLHTGAGAYDDGDGKDLGGALEFRSGLELARELERSNRLGFGFYHISNARFYDHNPGSNSLVLIYAF